MRFLYMEGVPFPSQLHSREEALDLAGISDFCNTVVKLILPLSVLPITGRARNIASCQQGQSVSFLQAFLERSLNHIGMMQYEAIERKRKKTHRLR